MKKRLFMYRITKIIAFCLIFVSLFNYSYKILSWKDGVGGYASAMTTLYNDLEDDIADVLFLGSSHCFCSISNTQLWDEYGIGAFNMVVSGQDLASTYYCMDEVLKTQSPKVICVELMGITIEEHAVVANIYRNTLGFKYSKNFFGIVDAIAPDEDKKDYLLKWPIIHTRYRELEKEDFIHLSPSYLGGNGGSENIRDVGELYVYQEHDTIPISAQNEEWLNKIINLANEKNIDLVFFIVPYITEEDTQKQFRYVEQLAAYHNITVINYFDKINEIGFDAHTDFQDKGHTNGNGAKKITSHIGAYLKENYDLPDRRGDEQYKLWEENSIVLSRRTLANELRTTNDINLYFDKIKQNDKYTIIITSNGNYNNDGSNTLDCFDTIGIDKSFSINGGACVIDNNKIIYLTNEKEFNYYYDMSESVVSLKGNAGNNVISVNRSPKKLVDDGFNIVIYDNILKETIDCFGLHAPKNYKLIR